MAETSGSEHAARHVTLLKLSHDLERFSLGRLRAPYAPAPARPLTVVREAGVLGPHRCDACNTQRGPACHGPKQAAAGARARVRARHVAAHGGAARVRRQQHARAQRLGEHQRLAGPQAGLAQQRRLLGLPVHAEAWRAAQQPGYRVRPPACASTTLPSGSSHSRAASSASPLTLKPGARSSSSACASMVGTCRRAQTCQRSPDGRREGWG